jgi:hypothetical protein
MDERIGGLRKGLKAGGGEAPDADEECGGGAALFEAQVALIPPRT